MNLTNATTLLNHLKWLQTHRPDKFDMDLWIGWNKNTFDSETGVIEDLNEWLKENKITEPVSPTECNTVACLAGHAALLAPSTPDTKDTPIYNIAVNWLELDHNTAKELFYAESPLWKGRDSTLENAIEVLQELIQEEEKVEEE